MSLYVTTLSASPPCVVRRIVRKVEILESVETSSLNAGVELTFEFLRSAHHYVVRTPAVPIQDLVSAILSR